MDVTCARKRSGFRRGVGAIKAPYEPDLLLNSGRQVFNHNSLGQHSVLYSRRERQRFLPSERRAGHDLALTCEIHCRIRIRERAKRYSAARCFRAFDRALGARRLREAPNGHSSPSRHLYFLSFSFPSDEPLEIRSTSRGSSSGSSSPSSARAASVARAWVASRAEWIAASVASMSSCP